ncbi:type II toxin-antitoxin system RelE/ParE family toxin [Succinimonas sp.]|uniref:type II toxin-antitoxin system RelE/ParE family toxin n=1 Tax=Succinimonas sp. TaxID=1936151 RepID=UPI00386539AD
MGTQAREQQGTLFYHKDDTYVLLHQFRKKTQKTPRCEIDKAKSERDDWKSRKGCFYGNLE